MQTSSASAQTYWVTRLSLGDEGCENKPAATAARQTCHPGNAHITTSQFEGFLKKLFYLTECPCPSVLLLSSVDDRVHTHSLPMVVLSSFTSHIVAELWSVDSGVSRSTSTMGGSAGGRIPLQTTCNRYTSRCLCNTHAVY